MKLRLVMMAAAATWAIAASHVTGRAQEPPAKTAASVADGVYSEEQAKRGEAIYNAECSSCHGTAMEGADMAPPLTGGAFMGNWNGLTVGDLFERIRVSMPDGNPGKLTREQNADVVAYILKFSKYPAGKAELAHETEVLKQIKIVAPKS
jgi:mono/diheme cytochrome c family protein